MSQAIEKGMCDSHSVHRSLLGQCPHSVSAPRPFEKIKREHWSGMIGAVLNVVPTRVQEMKIFSKSKLAGLAAISAGCILASGLPAMAEGISLSAETTSATEMGGMTDADFTLSVSNTSSMPVSDLSVAFEGGASIYVGDIAAGGSSAAMPVSMSLDTTAMPTRNFPVPVTINYIQAASVVEETSSVTVPLGAE